MARRKIALMAAPLCAAALLAAPARAGDSLFDSAGAAPVADAPAAPKAAKPKIVKPKPVAQHKPAKPKRVEANVQPAPEAAPPAAAEPEPSMAFGQQMPRQSLINRFTDPAPAPAAPASGVSASTRGVGAQPTPEEPEEETLPNGMPKKFLLNRLFDSSALEPAQQPDPRSFMAQAQPAAEPSLFDRAAGALGFADKEEKPTGNLPPVNVTAPAKPDRKPKDAKPAAASAAPAPAAAVAPPPAAAPQPSGWFDRATSAVGLGGSNDPVPDYSERPKLAVPQNRDALPLPRPMDERRVPRPPETEALTRPPASFTEKVQGADGKVSGFTDQDEGKKGWFNWF